MNDTSHSYRNVVLHPTPNEDGSTLINEYSQHTDHSRQISVGCLLVKNILSSIFQIPQTVSMVCFLKSKIDSPFIVDYEEKDGTKLSVKYLKERRNSLPFL